MYIASVPNRGSPPALLLRESYRERGKVKTRTLANLSKLPPDAVEALRRALKGQTLVPAEQQFQIHESRAHGHGQAVLGALRRLDLPRLLASRACPERERVLALIIARILEPRPKLATARWLRTTTVPEMLGLGDFDEDDLYAAMDWLLRRQPRIERRLAARHLCEDGLALFDLSSTYVEGEQCELAAFGYSRDGKWGRKQVNFGLLTDAAGVPVASSVFRGDVSDPNTLMPQVAMLRERFGLERFVLVGDRGMLTQAHVSALRDGQMDWITALRSSALRPLVEARAIQLDLFDETGLFELAHPDYPGERLVACRNPQLAKRRAAKRQALLEATVRRLQAVQARVAAGRLKAPDKIGVAVGKVIDRNKVGKHFVLDIGEGRFEFSVDQAKVAREAALDGIYVIRTSVGAGRLSAPAAVRQYKRLCQVERAFRAMKTMELKVRPLHHRRADRVRAHIFLCMLAYYVQQHLREAWRPLLFADEEPDAKRADSPVAPAQRSESARRKAHTRRLEDGRMAHSFRTLLLELARLTKNTCAMPGEASASGSAHTFELVSRPNPTQREALELVETIQPGPPVPV